MKANYLFILLLITISLTAQDKNKNVDFSIVDESIKTNKDKRCEATYKKYQKKIDKVKERLDKQNAKSISPFGWAVWYGWRVNMMQNKLNRIELKAQENCAYNQPLRAANGDRTGRCSRCQRVGECACNNKRISYKPCDLYASITQEEELKKKLLKNYDFIDFFAIKDLRRVICDTLAKLRKQAVSNSLNKELGQKVVPASTASSVSAPGTTTNVELAANQQPVGVKEKVPETNEKILLNIQRFSQDSTDLTNCFIGGQTFSMGNITGFQNFADLPDDNPQQITQFNFNYSLPLKKLNGKMVCNYRKPYTYVWFRNLYFTSALTPVTVASKLFYARALDTTFNGKHGIYANYLDLVQYSRLRVHMNFNIVTYISRYYSVYGNVHGGLGRCEVKYGENSDKTNYYDYGLNLSLRTKFKIPINMVASYHLYLLDVNSDIIIPNLNRQYSDVYKKPDNYYRLSTKNSQFNTFNITFQYDLRSITTNDDPGTGNKNSTAPTFIYASLSYNTNRMLGPRYNQQAHNNFLMIQLGYSRNFDEFANAVKSVLGIGKTGTTAAVE